MIRAAVISDCGLYRYRLTREWDAGKGAVNFVMLNPSTADGLQDDATIRRCIGFARTWGFRKLVVTNLYAFRATNPKRLWEVDDPRGPENGRHVDTAMDEADQVILAWGAHGKRMDNGDLICVRVDPKIFHLGLTRDGRPKHPLYLPANTERISVLAAHP